MYSGLKFIGDDEMDLRERNCDQNLNLDEAVRFKCSTYRYSSPYGYSIDLPHEWSDTYRATVGFKANHSFNNNNCGFIAIDHPRHEC